MTLSRLLQRSKTLLLISTMAAACPALEVPLGLPGVQARMQADWKQAPLGDTLNDLAKRVGLPLKASAGIAKRITTKETVSVIDAAPRSIAAVLEDLEDDQDLYIAITEEGMAVSTAQEADAEGSSQQVMDINRWFDQLPSRKARYTGGLYLNEGGTYQNGFEIFTKKKEVPSAENDPGLLIMDLAISILQPMLSDKFSCSVRDSHLVVSAPKHAAARLMHRLSRFSEERNRYLMVQATFGLVPAEAMVLTGIMPKAKTEALRGQLRDPRVIQAQTQTALNGEGAAGGEEMDLQSYLTDTEVVNNNQDPTVNSIGTGRTLAACRRSGSGSSLVEFVLSWTDPLATRSAKSSHPHVVGSGDGSGEIRDVLQSTIRMPACWTWNPRAVASLAAGSALVLATSHPEGQAVMIVEYANAPNGFTIPARFLAIPGDRPLLEQLMAIAGQCNAGLTVSRQCAAAADLGSPAKLPAQMDWAALGAALAVRRIALVPCGDRLLAIDAGSETPVSIFCPVSILAPPIHQPGFDFSISQPGGSPEPLASIPGGTNGFNFNGSLEIIKGSWGESPLELVNAGLLNGMLLTGRPRDLAKGLGTILAMERTMARVLTWRLHAVSDVPAGAILDAQQWAAVPADKRPCLATFLSRDGQQNRHFAGIAYSYLADADVKQGQYDPIMSTLLTGMSCQVLGRSAISAEGVAAAVDLQISNLVEMISEPINAVTKDHALVSLDCPRITVKKTGRRALIPTGGAMVLVAGGTTYALTCSVTQP